MKPRSVRKAAVVLALVAFCACRRQESPSERLLALAPRSERPIDARLTGFDWQEARVQRGPHANLLDPARLELAGAASTVIQSLTNDPSARARHEAGAAYLLIERDRDAIDALESAVRQSPTDAAYWSDLAAARYTLAVRENRPHELPQALADADHALRLHPRLPDALFNRALIIESLGVTEAARRAWQRYVAADPSTHWSTEAMHHLGNLRVVTTRDEFQDHLATASRAFRTGNDAPLIALARNYPQESRTWSEGPLLAKWADAIHKNDANTATETLSIVRKLGAALVEFNGVHSVADMVAVIDRANATDTRMLADAQAIYRDGRILYRDRRTADAQVQLLRARDLFTRAGSPMALITDYYIASCIHGSNRITEALHALDDVTARVDVKRYPALAAEIGWERAVTYGSIGQWEAAIRNASHSRQLFSRLGETQNRAEMDILLAGCLSKTSQPDSAWKANIAAFPVLSRGGSFDRIQVSLITAMNVEAAQYRFDTALALATIALDELHHTNPPSGTAAAEAMRAKSLSMIGERGAAHAAIRRARASAAAIRDINLRRVVSAAIDVAEGAVVRDENPVASLRLINPAIAFYESTYRNALPQAYLERGRTHVSAKDDETALADFESGIREVDAQRSSIADRNLRGTVYDTQPELFSEAINLLLRRGDTERAFEFSDRARARSVYEQLGDRTESELKPAPAAQLRSSLPSGTALIEYAVLRDHVVIFFFSSDTSGVVKVAVKRAALAAMVDRYAGALQYRRDLGPTLQASADLYRLLIEPVTTRLVGIHSLIVVPDRELHGVPFAALYDQHRGRYVIDEFRVSIATSAATVLSQSGSSTLEPALIVGDPHDDNAASLQNAASEAETIAAMYPSSTLLTGERATRARFIAAARTSGLIHYAGHADTDSFDSIGSLHLARNAAADSGDLDTAAIAALHLQNAPLVILAACGTMRGNSEHVEGMPSIARSFLAAGARNVIGTLWDVDDDVVAPLFRRIHEELRNGSNTADALRNAQLAFAHAPEAHLSHPATWAPVELLGDANGQVPTRVKRNK